MRRMRPFQMKLRINLHFSIYNIMGVERRIFVAVLIGLATIAGVRVSAEDLPRPVTQIYRVGIGGAEAR